MNRKRNRRHPQHQYPLHAPYIGMRKHRLARVNVAHVPYREASNKRHLHVSSPHRPNLIKYGIEIGAKKLIFASSVSIYGPVGDRQLVESDFGDPSSCYGVSKMASEGYLRIYHKQLPYVNMRMFNVYGPGQDLDNLRQGMVSIYLAQAIRVGNVHVKGSLKRFRDYIFIDDVVEAWFRASTFETVRNISLNVGTGVRTSVEQLLDLIKNELPQTEWYVEGSTLGDQFGHYSNNTLLREALQMSEFTQLPEGMKKFVNWAKKK